jgi:hypothetical protein
VTETGEEFALRDAATGRLKRIRKFKGTVAKHWKNLRADFPFDVDAVGLYMYSNSHYVSYDEEKKGAVQGAKAYRLHQVRQGAKEGRWITLWWNGAVAEWQIDGISTQLCEEAPQDDGTETTALLLNFHVSRKYGYYLSKALMPIYMLVTLSLTTFCLPLGDLADRSDTVGTYVLSLFALLFVVGDCLPKLVRLSGPVLLR